MTENAMPEMPNSTKLDQSRAREYMLAGDAIVTFRNVETGNRYTFRITKPDDRGKECPHFVKSLFGPYDVIGHQGRYRYKYFGNIWEGTKLAKAKQASISWDGKPAKVFRWIWAQIDDLPEAIEIWHEGACLRCGRRLTVPESIASGYGPICGGRK